MMKAKAMKKTLSCILALTTAASMFTGTAFADEETADNTEVTETAEITADAEPASEPGYGERDVANYTENGFTVTEDGTLVGYSGTDVNIVIPSKVNGITVKSIAGNWYEDPFCEGIASTVLTIELPSTLERIDKWAFINCTKLTHITIPKSVTYIGDEAFKYDTALARVDFEAGSKLEEIGYRAFGGCNYLTYIDIPDNCKTIGGNAFLNCTKLAIVDFPDKLETIGSYAFCGCSILKGCSKTQLDKIVLPDSIVTIYDHAFKSCSSLTDITIGKSLDTVGEYAFESCTELANVNFLGGKTLSKDAFYRCYSLVNITIPGSFKTLGSYLFDCCYNLETLTLGSGIETIGDHLCSVEDYYSAAEWRCSKLKSIVFPNSVKSIGSRAFYKLPNLESVTFGAGLETIGVGAFEGTAIKNLVLPDKVVTLDKRAFAACKSLANVHFGNKVHTINDEAFRGCSSLKSVFLPDSTEIVASYAFADCTELQSFVTGKLMTSLRNYTFYEDRKLTTITFPDYINSIGNDVFKTCSSLTDIYFIGSIADWNFLLAQNPESYLKTNIENYIVHCTDGIYKDGTTTNLSVSSIKIKTEPQTTFTKDDDLNVDGGYITATFSDGSSVDIAMTTTMVSGFDSSKTGSQTLTVTYGSASATYTVNIQGPVATSISMAQNPTKTEFKLGQQIDVTGGKISVNYNNGTSENIDMTFAMVSGYDANKPGYQTVTVTYDGLKTTYTVNVIEITITKIDITVPTKTQYLTGSELDLTGGRIVVTYSDGTSENVTMTKDMVTGFDPNSETEQTLTVTYGTESKTYKVTVASKPAFKLQVNGETETSLSAALSKLSKTEGVVTITLAENWTEAKSITLPKKAKQIIIEAPFASPEKPVKLTLKSSSLTFNKDVKLENVEIITNKGKAIGVTAKGDLDMSGCIVGNVQAKSTASIENSTILGKLDLKAKANGSVTTIDNTTITKDVKSNNDIIFTDCDEIGSITTKGSVTVTSINGTTTGQLTSKSSTGTTTLENVTVTKKLTTKNALSINSDVTVKGAISVPEIGSLDGATLSYQSLSVTKNGLTVGSAGISLIMIDKNGAEITLTPGKKDIVVVKSFKQGKVKNPSIEAFTLGGKSSGAILSFKSNKIIIKKV